jgi:hypothetical protein
VADSVPPRPTAIPIPEGWTVEQAEAVLDFLHALETAVFVAYEEPLTQRAYLEACAPPPHDDDYDLDDDDLIPF